MYEYYIIRYLLSKFLLGGILREDKKSGISKNCGCELARPYVNDQTFTKMYSLSAALNKGTLFPELYLMDSLMYNKELYSTPKKLRGGKR